MEFIAHRINTAAELAALDPNYGAELDLRDDLTGRIYIAHNPFVAGEDFEKYLAGYRHGTMILNIKSERIEEQALRLLKKYNIKKYFFLDSTFPMIKSLSDTGEQNFALRYSELEGIDTLRLMRGKVKWVWADCFTKFPLTIDSYQEIKKLGYKICLVSPELEGHGDDIAAYKKIIHDNNFIVDAICTKSYNIEKWR